MKLLKLIAVVWIGLILTGFALFIIYGLITEPLLRFPFTISIAIAITIWAIMTVTEEG